MSTNAQITYGTAAGDSADIWQKWRREGHPPGICPLRGAVPPDPTGGGARCSFGSTRSPKSRATGPRSRAPEPLLVPATAHVEDHRREFVAEGRLGLQRCLFALARVVLEGKPLGGGDGRNAVVSRWSPDSVVWISALLSRVSLRCPSHGDSLTRALPVASTSATSRAPTRTRAIVIDPRERRCPPPGGLRGSLGASALRP